MEDTRILNEEILFEIGFTKVDDHKNEFGGFPYFVKGDIMLFKSAETEGYYTPGSNGKKVVTVEDLLKIL